MAVPIKMMNMSPETSNNSRTGTVQSVRRAMEIVEEIRERDGATLAELADEFDIAKSTIHSHVSTLCQEGYLVKEGYEYRAGAMFLRLGEYARTRRPEYKMAAEKVEELANQSEERAQFAIEEHERVVFLYQRNGAHAANTGTEIGRRRYLHTSSVGKAILAHLPDERIQTIIDNCGLPKVTAHTITDESELWEMIELIRERGYAVNTEENIEGVCAVGAPVRNGDEVIGALSVSGPTHRLQDERLHRDVANLVLGEANELELNIKYS